MQKKEKKPVGKLIQFQAEIDGEKVNCTIGDVDIPKFRVGRYGVMTSEEAVKNPGALAWLIENECTIIKIGGN